MHLRSVTHWALTRETISFSNNGRKKIKHEEQAFAGPDSESGDEAGDIEEYFEVHEVEEYCVS
jgi:hypothetical protein